MTLYINRTNYTSGFSQKNLACGAICFISFACGAMFSSKNLACGAFFFIKNLCYMPDFYETKCLCDFYHSEENKSTLGRPTVNRLSCLSRVCCCELSQPCTCCLGNSFGFQPKQFERKMTSFVTISNDSQTWPLVKNKQTNKQTNGENETFRLLVLRVC